MRAGIAVECAVCHRVKQPHGRSVLVNNNYCNHDCAGYLQAPLPGCLWPGETSNKFKYEACERASKEVEEPASHEER